MTEKSRSLSSLLGEVQTVLGRELGGQHWIIAEIMELNENRTGHCYLELIEKNEEDDEIWKSYL